MKGCNYWGKFSLSNNLRYDVNASSANDVQFFPFISLMACVNVCVNDTFYM